jgi:hypothetical protein
MIIYPVPDEFMPQHKTDYPPYCNGKYMEEVCHEYFLKHKDTIHTDRIYLPVYWTAYAVTHNYHDGIEPLSNWLNTLDKTKKYFTIVQCAHGIWVKEKLDFDIKLFSAGGGGFNVKSREMLRDVWYYDIVRWLFFGQKGDYDLPLICMPSFPNTNAEKNIYCSFVGRFDTHPCRFVMRNILKNIPEFVFHESMNYNSYLDVVNRSVFTLAPRGFGYTSFRLFEALLADSIPIYIWSDKNVLPYKDIIDWNEIAIVVHENNISEIPDLMKKIDIPKMQSKIKELKYLFTYDGMNKYITDKIEYNVPDAIYNQFMEVIKKNNIPDSITDNEILEFENIYDREICEIPGAMSIESMLALYVTLKKVNPRLVIESGVGGGATTYIIRKVMPYVNIICLDPSLLPYYTWRDSCEYTKYNIGSDFIDFKDMKITDTDHLLVVFDDQQNQASRLFQCYNKGVTHVFFANNYPPGCGKFVSLEKFYRNDIPNTQNIMNESTRQVRRMIKQYCIYPNIFPGKIETRDGLFDCKSIFENNLKMYDYPLYYLFQQNYRWPTYIKLNKDTRRISIAITHYNNSDFLYDSIYDVMNDYRVGEIVICDDKSRDDELQKLEALLLEINCPKIKLHKNDVNIGCYHNKINAVSKCTNDWVILLDSDNIIMKGFVDTLYNISKWLPDTIYHPSWPKTFPGKPSIYLDFRSYEGQYITSNIYINDFKDSKFQCLINNCNYFLERNHFYKCMEFVQQKYDRHLIDSVDSAVLFTDWLLDKNKVYIVPNLEYGHRLHSNSNFILTSAKSDRNQILKGLLEQIKQFVLSSSSS